MRKHLGRVQKGGSAEPPVPAVAFSTASPTAWQRGQPSAGHGILSCVAACSPLRALFDFPQETAGSEHAACDSFCAFGLTSVPSDLRLSFGSMTEQKQVLGANVKHSVADACSEQPHQWHLGSSASSSLSLLTLYIYTSVN